jgi:hypothetical protein
MVRILNIIKQWLESGEPSFAFFFNHLGLSKHGKAMIVMIVMGAGG